MNPLRHLLPSLLALAVPGLATAQAPQRELLKPQEFTTGQDDSLYSVTRSQEEIHEWERALQELDAGEFATAVERLHRLMQHDTAGVVPIGPGRFAGLRLAALQTLANLTPKGAAAYEQLVAREAGALAQRPLTTLPAEQLRTLADRFPAAAVGRAARLRLGDLALEQGRGAEAAQHFRLALDAAPIGSRAEAAAAARLRAADALQRPGELRAATGELSQVLEAVPPTADEFVWSSAAGGIGGAPPMADPVGQPLPRWNAEVSAPGFEFANNSYPMQLTGDLDAVYLHRGTELVALNPLRQSVLWTSPSPILDQNAIGVMREYAQSINGNMVLAAALGGDVVVAALQVPDQSTTVRYMSNYTIMTKLPERRLFAFDRRTGKLLWSHFDQIDGPVTRRYRGHAACGPPLVVDDTVYAPVHDRSGAIAFYVGAYDLRTGQPRWRRLVCSSQQEVNMFGNARREFAASPLTAKDGLLFGCSNLGVAYAIEQASGRLRWLTAYEALRMPETQLHHQAERPVFFQNNAPVLCDGVVCCTPLDSEFAVALDAETGRRQWQLPHEARANGPNFVRWLIGAIDDEFVLAGAGVIAIKARADKAQPRQVRGFDQLHGDETGDCPRPALGRNGIYYPAGGRVQAFGKDGAPLGTLAELRFRGVGNLLLLDGLVLSLSGRLLEAAFDPVALERRADERLQRMPDEPDAILQLCTLRAALGAGDQTDPAALVALYRRGLQACVQKGLPADQPPRSVFQRALFEAALAEAMATQGSARRERLLTARELAPDDAAFVQAQAELLQALQDDRAALLRELDLLASRALDRRGEFRDAGGTVSVAAYVLWRRAGLLPTPQEQIAAWQQLLEEQPAAVIQQRTARELAQAAIVDLIAAHGAPIYAPIEQRAAEALTRAGDDRNRLQAISERFPTSAAAAAARARLLDLAVEQGDLASAVDVLALALRAESEPPGLLRRVLEAARRRGNFGLAQAVGARLQRHRELASDWPADGGRNYGLVLAGLPVEPTPGGDPAAVPPEVVLAAIPNPTPRTVPKLLPTTVAPGFAVAPDAPVYLLTAADKLQLRAVAVSDKQHSTLFARDLEQLADHCWRCGTTAILFDPQLVQAFDHRTGEVRWQLPQDAFYDCFGVIQGVLLLSAQTSRSDGESPVLLGVEPLTGRVLFRRILPLAEGPAAPKATATDLLWLRTGRDGMAIERIDPLTGATRVTVPLRDETLAELGLRREVLQQALMLPREFAADDERIYLKSEPPMAEGVPRAVAVRNDGAIAWRWRGASSARLVLARRGGRLVLAEGAPLFTHNQSVKATGGNRVLVLDAPTGAVQREFGVGEDFLIRNWQHQRFDLPLPKALLGEDSDPVTGDRRLVCVGIEDDVPTFAEPFGAADDDLVASPLLGDNLVVFGHRPDRGGNVRVFALDLDSRKGALLGGNKYLRLRGPVTGMGPAGPYTAVASQEGLLLLGPAKDAR